MAVAGVSSLSMQCKICWGNSVNPQKLFCGHTFCFSCINYFTESIILETRFNDSLPSCPICFSNSQFCININNQENTLLGTHSNADGIPFRKTGLGYWFGQKTNSHNPKLPVLDLFLESEESPKFTIPSTKLKCNSSEMSVNGNGLSQKRRKDRMVFSNFIKSNGKHFSADGIVTSNLKLSVRSKQILDSLENAEIKFLQPDSTLDKTICSEGLLLKEDRLNDLLARDVACHSDKVPLTSRTSIGSFNIEETEVYDVPLKDDSSISDSCSALGSTDRTTPGTDCSFDFDLFESHEMFSANNEYNSADILNPTNESTIDMSTKHIDLTKCSCSTNQVTSIFCITCQCSTCSLCIIEKHQSCQIKMDKDVAMQLTQQLEIKANVLGIVMFELEEQIRQFKAKCLNICKAVNQLTDFIIDIIKCKHNTIIEELDKSQESGLKELTSQYSRCKEMKTDLSSYCQMLRSTNKETVSPLFLEVDAPILKELKNNTKKLYLQPLFELNMFVVKSFLEMQVHPLGYIKVRENMELPLSRTSVLTPFPPNSNILEECSKECSPRKLMVCGTKCGTDTNAQTDINSVAILPKHRVLLSSPVNYQVKLFSFRGMCLGELKFSTPPIGVCLWKQTILLVTFPHDSKILFLSYESRLAVDVTVSTKKGYFSLASGKGNSSNYLFATASFSTNVDILEFDQLKQEFLVLKQISLNIKPWGYACNLCQAPDETIVVADCFGNRVVAFRINGTILFEIHGNDRNQLKCPADVTADNFSIFVSDVGSNRILRFDLNDHSMNVLLTSRDGLLRPKSIDMNAMGYLAISQFTEWPALIIFQTIKP